MANEKKEVVPAPVKTTIWKDGFFGWTNFKWIITEARDIYSNKDSYFSKKRIESGVAFIIAQWGMIFFLMKRYETMTMSDFLFWAGVEFAVSGYIINKIQQEKKDDASIDNPDK